MSYFKRTKLEDGTSQALAKIDDNGIETNIKDLIIVLRSLLFAIANPSYIDKSANQLRAQITGVLTTLTTCTTVTTVANMTNIDSYQGKMLMINSNINAWANTQRRLIT